MTSFTNDERETLLTLLTNNEGLKLHRVDYLDHANGYWYVKEDDKKIDYPKNDADLYYIAVLQHDVLGKMIDELREKIKDINYEIACREE